MFKKIINISAFFVIIMLTGCSENPKYLDTVNYNSIGAFVVKEKVNSMGNVPPYLFTIETSPNFSNENMSFLISANSRYSNPEVILYLDMAKIVFKGKELPTSNKDALYMEGVVNPRNGQTSFNKLEIKFPYYQELKFGKKIGYFEKEKEAYHGFKIVIPAELEGEATEIVFNFERYDISGQNRFQWLNPFSF